METAEQKPKKNTALYIIIAILVIAIIVVYYIFFGQEKLIQNTPAPTGETNVINTATQEVGQNGNNVTNSYSSATSSSFDATGGLSSLKLTPEDILNNKIFQSLHPYAEPVELPTLGRPNPFIPY